MSMQKNHMTMKKQKTIICKAFYRMNRISKGNAHTMKGGLDDFHIDIDRISEIIFSLSLDFGYFIPKLVDSQLFRRILGTKIPQLTNCPTVSIQARPHLPCTVS